MQAQMRAGRPHHGASAVVRCHGQLPGIGHGGNFAGLGQPTAPAQVQHGHAGHTGLQIVFKTPLVAERLASANQRIRMRRVLF